MPSLRGLDLGMLCFYANMEEIPKQKPPTRLCLDLGNSALLVNVHLFIESTIVSIIRRL